MHMPWCVQVVGVSGRYACAMVHMCRGQRVVLFLHYAGPRNPTQIVRSQQAPLPTKLPPRSWAIFLNKVLASIY